MLSVSTRSLAAGGASSRVLAFGCQPRRIGSGYAIIGPMALTSSIRFVSSSSSSSSSSNPPHHPPRVFESTTGVRKPSEVFYEETADAWAQSALADARVRQQRDLHLQQQQQQNSNQQQQVKSGAVGAAGAAKTADPQSTVTIAGGVRVSSSFADENRTMGNSTQLYNTAAGSSAGSSSGTAAATTPNSSSSPAAVPSPLFKGTPNEFIDLVHESPVLVVNFTAKWCKPCVEIRGEWDRLIEHFGTATATAANDLLRAGEGGAAASSSASTSAAEGGAGDAAAISSSTAAAARAIKVSFIDIDISENDTLAALHDVRCVPTYCCYIGGGGGGVATPPAPTADASSVKKASGKKGAKKTKKKAVAAGINADDNSAASTMKETVMAAAVAASYAKAAAAVASHAETGESGVPQPSDGDEDGGDDLDNGAGGGGGGGSRGLFGTVEGAHLDKVHAMIEAAQQEVVKG